VPRRRERSASPRQTITWRCCAVQRTRSAFLASRLGFVPKRHSAAKCRSSAQAPRIYTRCAWAASAGRPTGRAPRASRREGTARSRRARTSTPGALHAATRARAHDTGGREALLRYALRPPIAQERHELHPDGLVRVVLKRAFSDATVAVDMDPLSLLVRLATSVPPPRYHTVNYAGVLASASPWRARIGPRSPSVEPSGVSQPAPPSKTLRESSIRTSLL
jgi:hypothetical protein